MFVDEEVCSALRLSVRWPHKGEFDHNMHSAEVRSQQLRAALYNELYYTILINSLFIKK